MTLTSFVMFSFCVCIGSRTTKRPAISRIGSKQMLLVWDGLSNTFASRKKPNHHMFPERWSYKNLPFQEITLQLLQTEAETVYMKHKQKSQQRLEGAASYFVCPTLSRRASHAGRKMPVKVMMMITIRAGLHSAPASSVSENLEDILNGSSHRCRM